ncbi:hypothetical protein [Gordonia rhizosphera]|uniref:hypothetical protein n=1 Tax=Gordonia rhizosphera TaxID=83341 RepID=UPI001FDF7484|nr:hypothetical protein [Gordonia rhizosphera]
MLSDATQADEMSTILAMFEALYGDSITVAVRTAEDVDDVEVGFVGEIPHAHEFGPMQRDLLLSQVSPAPADLPFVVGLDHHGGGQPRERRGVGED